MCFDSCTLSSGSGAACYIKKSGGCAVLFASSATEGLYFTQCSTTRGYGGAVCAEITSGPVQFVTHEAEQEASNPVILFSKCSASSSSLSDTVSAGGGVAALVRGGTSILSARTPASSDRTHLGISFSACYASHANGGASLSM